MKKTYFLTVVMAIIFIFAPVLLCLEAEAASTPPVELTPEASTKSLLDNYKEAMEATKGNVQKYAKRLFYSLAMIQLVYNMGMLIINGKTDMQSFTATVVRQIMIIGIFFFLLDKGPDIFDTIIKSFRMAATGDGTLPEEVCPGTIYSTGLSVLEKLKVAAWSNTGFLPGNALGYGDYLYITLICALILACFAIITAVYTLVLIKTYFICSAGMLFLGFGGSEWSNDIAKSTLKCVFSVGAECFVVLLIAHIAETVISGWAPQITPTMTKGQISTLSGIMASMSMILAILSVTAPGLASGLISGSAIGAGGTAAVSDGVGKGAVAVGMGAAKVAGKAVVGAAKIVGPAGMLAGGAAIGIARDFARRAADYNRNSVAP